MNAVLKELQERAERRQADDFDDTVVLSVPTGVFRVTYEPVGSPHAGQVMTRATELSLRYPVGPTDFSRRQAE